MRIDRRLVLIGVMLVVLSMTMATQYATTKIGYSYDIVHPSNADIRFIGSDKSANNTRVLWAENNGTTARLTLNFGNISANYNKTYTAAFGIVNEEQYSLNITHINVSATADYLQIWLHGDRDQKAGDDGTSVFMWDKGSQESSSSSTAWVLANNSVNSTADFVWVQISLDIPASPVETDETGSIYIHFEAAAE